MADAATATAEDRDADASVDVSTLRIEPGRAGAYAIVDAAGREAGKLRGDYVIGFTARYCGMVRWFADLDQAKTAVAAAHLERQGAIAP